MYSCRYEEARTAIADVFGPKLSTKFPRKYLKSKTCGDGFYESRGKNNVYEHPGVEAEASAGEKLYAPFQGILQQTGPKQITIVVTGMRNVEAIVDNVNVDPGQVGLQVGQQDVIGTVAAPDWCDDAHVHLAMRKNGTKNYIDPSKYMIRREFPMPKWIQKCDHYFFIWKNKVVSHGTVTGGPVEENKTPKIQEPPDLSQINIEISGRPKRFVGNFIDKLVATSENFTKSLGLPGFDKLKKLFNFNFNKMTLGFIIDKMDSLGLSRLKNKIIHTVEKVQSQTNNEECLRPDTMDNEELKRALKRRGKSVSGVRKTLIKRLLDADSECLSIRNRLMKNIYCKFDKACLGVSCCLDLKLFVFRHSLVAFARFDPCKLTLVVGVNDWIKTIQIVDGDFAIDHTSMVEHNMNIMQAVQLIVRYRVVKTRGKLMVSLGTSWCSTRAEECMLMVDILKEAEIPIQPCNQNLTSPVVQSERGYTVKQMLNMTIGDVMRLVDFSGFDSEDIELLIEDLRQAFQKWLITKIEQTVVRIFGNEFNLKETCLYGKEIRFGPYYQRFFVMRFFIMVGPVPIIFEFGAGGHFGVRCRADLCLASMTAVGRVNPMIGSSVYGSAKIWLWLLTAELRLTGYLLTTKFPTKLVVEFSKFPLAVRARMDLDLIPLYIELRAILIFELKIKIGFVKIHIRRVLINKRLWYYMTPQIIKNIFNLNDAERDPSPPDFSFYTKSKCLNCPEGEDYNPLRIPKDKFECNNCSDALRGDIEKLLRGRRSALIRHRRALASGNQCIVKQKEGLDYTEPAFNIEVAAADDRSEVYKTLCVGTYPGGCDVVYDEPLGGASSLMFKKLTSGVPLFFTVTAKNNQGDASHAVCELGTYDTSLPGGRITPAFLATSNPKLLKMTVMIQDDSPLLVRLVAVGFGIGIHGDQLVSYNPFTIEKRTSAVNTGFDPHGLRELEHFSAPRVGRLVTAPFKVSRFANAPACARDCRSYPPAKCLSFNYNYGTDGTCELLNKIEGSGVEIHETGLFQHFERLGTGHATALAFSFTVDLHHNILHYYNVYLFNAVGYKNFIYGKATLTDLTPPSPGPLSNVKEDKLIHERCASFTPIIYQQRCQFETSLRNYRYIIDGEGSKTIFNGHTPLLDQKYTRANRMIAANWDGIHNNETGILVYTCSVGTRPCKDDVEPHKDPHEHLFHASEWTHVAVFFPVQLADGAYHVTIRALTNVDAGGPMALTVCHQRPYIVDTTPPIVYDIYNVQYDEDTAVLSSEFNVTDRGSGLLKTEVGLGKSKRDTYVRGWDTMQNFTFVSLPFKLPDGVPVWVKIRATDNVDLRTVHHAKKPIVVDSSPPVPGNVYDGVHTKKDLKYQSSKTELCANWHDFYDAESGISKYRVGFGTWPGLDNIVPFTMMGTHSSIFCKDQLPLQHNHKYYATVTAYNYGHKEKNVTAYSNGVLVDNTAPVEGWIKDGDVGSADLEFSSDPATAKGHWGGISDPESGLKDYALSVLRKSAGNPNNEVSLHQVKGIEPRDTSEAFHHLHFHHGDKVRLRLDITNNALLSTQMFTDGFTVDLTDPDLLYLGDGSVSGRDQQYTASTTQLSVNWRFKDEESGVDYYKLQLYEEHNGNKKQIYPIRAKTWVTLPNNYTGWQTDTSLSLKMGGHYSFRVSAVNRALLAAVHDTDGVTIDSTPADMLWVHAGVVADESEELIGGYVIHNDQEGIKGSWKAIDPESDVKEYLLAIGTSAGGTDVLKFTSMGLSRDGYIGNLHLSLTNTATNQPVYYITVKAINGAGVTSSSMSSSPIKVVQGDKEGVVHDGPDPGSDIDYQLDQTTVSVTLEGFESARDGIDEYQWAIGTNPRRDNVQAYTTLGLVIPESGTNLGHGIGGGGYGQAIVPMKNGKEMFVTVRAKTGAGNYLYSTGDGLTPDIVKPRVRINSVGTTSLSAGGLRLDAVYQKENDFLSGSWSINETESKVNASWFYYGTFPGSSDIYGETKGSDQRHVPVTLVKPKINGIPNILHVTGQDEVGLRDTAMSPAVMIDTTAPLPGTVTCPQNVQGGGQVECSWEGFLDPEGNIKHFQIGVGTEEGDDSIYNFQTLPAHQAKHVVKGITLEHQKTYYATVTAFNNVGMSTAAYSKPIVVDDTPPKGGWVVELSDTSKLLSNGSLVTSRIPCQDQNAYKTEDIICQRSLSHMSVAWQPFTDAETGVVRYELALGTTPGGSQVQGFKPVPKGRFALLVSNLDLSNVRQVFATVKGHNAAGLYSTAISNGVYISRISAGLPSLGKSYVYDGPVKGKDQSFQDHNEDLSGNWDFSGDPCPVSKLEWSIQRVDGTVVLPWKEVPTGETTGTADGLYLRDGESYFNIVRATNMLGYTYALHSDGISIRLEPLLPGKVMDGTITGLDLNYQKSTTELSAHWDGFGKDSEEGGIVINANPRVRTDLGKHQRVEYYEVAAGTDRRYPKTRNNIHPFINVGLNKTWTFTNLKLMAKKGTYYITVRAYAVTTAVVEVTSNGIKVGHNTDVISRGEITIPRFVSSKHVLELSWKNFKFPLPILFYQWGMGTVDDTIHHLTCTELQNYKPDGSIAHNANYSHLFDIKPLTKVGKDTFVKDKTVALEDRKTYHVVVVATDESGGCIVARAKVTVDTTPPVEGTVRVGPELGMKLLYTPTDKSIKVKWTGYSDDISGIKEFQISLKEASTCRAQSGTTIIQDFISVPANTSEYTFMDLSLRSDRPYFVNLKTKNNANAEISTVSRPILVDMVTPKAGAVVDGGSFRQDLTYQSSTTEVIGSYLYLPNPKGLPCPIREYPLTASSPSWKMIIHRGLWNVNNGGTIKFRKKQLTHSDPMGLGVRLQRDNNKKQRQMMSGAVYTEAHILKGGKFEFEIKAGSGKLKSVTSVVIWDGPTGVVGDYDVSLMDNKTVTAQQSSGDDNFFIKPDPMPHDTYLGDESDWTTDKVKAIGLQIHTDSYYNGEYGHWAVLWHRSPNDTGHITMPLKFDPSAAWHTYTISLNEDAEALFQDEWSVRVYADNKLVGLDSGVPGLGKNAKVVLTAWNRGSYVPNVQDVFHPPSTTAYFRNIKMPPTADSICAHGDPFRGGDNPILEFEAGVGTEKGKDDVVPFQKVRTPCMPCSRPCDEYLCKKSCKRDKIQEAIVHFKGLSLQEIKKVVDSSGNETYSTVMYFLTVKGLTGSGRTAISSSSGFYVDSSPPEVSGLMHLDATWSQDEPSDYQGSNDTIAIRWEARDNVSQIVKQEWAIGTTPGGTDIQDFTEEGIYGDVAINSKLEGILEDGKRYYATVQVYNGAGLKTTKSSGGVTLMLSDPDLTDVDTSNNGTKPLGSSPQTANTVTTSKQDELHVGWSTPKEDNKINRISYGLSSDGKKADIFPERAVGYNQSGEATISSDGFKVDDDQLDATPRTSRRRKRSVKSDHFIVEPGRRIKVILRGCNPGHRCAKMQTKDIMIVRNEDKVLIANKNGEIVDQVTPNIRVQTDSGQKTGTTLVTGNLKTSDLQEHYTSAAASNFKPYVVNPETTIRKTDRFLYKRICKHLGVNFFMTTPFNEKISGPVTVTARCDDPKILQAHPECEPRLLYWHTEDQQWRDASRSCPENVRQWKYDNTTCTVTATVCRIQESEPSVALRSKRAASTSFTGAAAFSVSAVNKKFINNPPVITSQNQRSMFEDGGVLTYKLTASDSDGDALVFLLNETATKITGNVSLGADGLLLYRPCQECSGIEIIYFNVVEQRTDGQTAMITAGTLTVVVTPSNDRPVAFLVDKGENQDTNNAHKIDVTVDQNTNTSMVINSLEVIIGAFDVDVNDSLRLDTNIPAHGNISLSQQVRSVTFTKQDCTQDWTERSSLWYPVLHNSSWERLTEVALPFPCQLNPTRPVTKLAWVVAKLSYIPEENYFGTDTFKVVAKDQEITPSELLDVTVHVLQNLCVNGGNCTGPADDIHCTSKRRSAGFAGYGCTCSSGYTGTYCEVDIDECESSPCPDNNTCLDGINSYTCHCQQGWPCAVIPHAGGLERWQVIVIAAVAGGWSLMFIIFITGVVCKSKKHAKKQNRVSPDRLQGSSDDVGHGRYRKPMRDEDIFRDPLRDSGMQYTIPGFWKKGQRPPKMDVPPKVLHPDQYDYNGGPSRSKSSLSMMSHGDSSGNAHDPEGRKNKGFTGDVHLDEYGDYRDMTVPNAPPSPPENSRKPWKRKAHIMKRAMDEYLPPESPHEVWGDK